MAWQDDQGDEFFDAFVEARRRMTGALDLAAGVHGLFVPDVERERNGEEPIVRRRDVFLPTGFVGVALAVR